jgi:amidase
MKHIDDGSDYIHPALKPIPTTRDRQYWQPSVEENPFNAWSHRCHLQAAHPVSNRLQGRTLAIKDNISVGGLPTTLGAPPELVSGNNTYPVSPIDATVISRLLAAGAIIKGTSTCECFCASPLSFTSFTGPVHNPRLQGYSAGGSSSGSSALVTANLLSKETSNRGGETVELAIGSDQAGSVRIPASYNGIYGLKPTFGLVPYTGAGSMCPMIDYLGPLAAELEGIAELLEIMAGYDGLDSRMTPESPLVTQVKPYSKILAGYQQQMAVQSGPTQKWTIGLLTESFSIPGVSPDVRDTVRKAATQFFEAAGATVVDISIPMHREGPIIWTASTRPSMSSWLYQGKPSGHLSYLPPHIQPRWPLSGNTFDSVTSSNPALGNILLSEKFAQRHLPSGIEAKAHRRVFELRDAYDKAFDQVDILVTPCAPTIAMPHSKSSENQAKTLSILERLEPVIGVTSNTCPFNVTGHPAMNVPCGFSSPPEHPETLLPIGMQLIGRRWADEQVIMAAALFERGRELMSN